MQEGPFTNRLIKEKSPYLLQHAHNPVDWYPWGAEAFEAARTQDKPIFLSIGYATCHWCHVMETESFEDPEVAKLLNDVFINVKVDREELPEIDSIYMEFAQALMASAGGWPLNVVLTPDQKPFFAVTYLPPKTRKGIMGLEQFAHHIEQLWHSEERTALVEQADKIVELFSKVSHAVGSEMPSERHILASVELLFELADPVYGGIKGEPKFPLGYQGNFLLEFTRAKKDSRSLFYVELTLDMMHRGGLYDHLGGGFSRYSVDEQWMIPHFEKMLYDNALLAKVYLDAWKFVRKPLYRVVCEEILDYTLRDMTHPEGGFYSAEDADSEGHEGLFYTWTAKEILETLPQNEAELFCHYYGVTPQGNFEGRNVLHTALPLEEFVDAIGLPAKDLALLLAKGRQALFKRREQRPRPFKDDKIITSWNGLMIDALIRAGSAFKKEAFRTAALKAAEFIRAQLWKDGKLLRRFREGEARFRAGLDDYACMIKGALSLFEENCGTHFLQWAIEMAAVLEHTFKAEGGAFYQTDGQEPILLRKCEFYDGAEPSGNAVHAENLLRLYQITQEEKYLNQVEDILKAAKNFIESYPPGACYHLMALQRYLDAKAPTLVIALDEKESLRAELDAVLCAHFCPHLTVIWKKKDDKQLEALVPSIADKLPIDGQTAVYLCRQDRCEPPLLVKDEIIKAIEGL
jgi:uncharacterized protein YyaL (SSP411 family)